MTRTVPPFRADHVGSLLRPRSLKEDRARRGRGEVSAADLRAAENAAIEHVIARQADTGLQSATDGEFLNAAGIPTYGIDPVFVGRDLGNIHGLNEYVGVQSLLEERDFLYRLIKLYADAR